MRITACDRRRQMLYRLTLDDGAMVVEVDLRTFDESGLRVGDSLDGEALDALCVASDERRARETALYLLSQRSHSRVELERKLSRRASRETAVATAQRCEELGLVDDARYAQTLARDLCTYKLYSRQHILQELAARGVSRDVAREAVDALEIDDEEQAVALLQRKYSHKLADEDGRRKTAAALVRAGFEYRTVRRAMERVAQTFADEDIDCP